MQARMCMHVCNHISGHMVQWYHIRFACGGYPSCVIFRLYWRAHHNTRCTSARCMRCACPSRHTDCIRMSWILSLWFHRLFLTSQPPWTRRRTSNPKIAGSSPAGGDHPGPAWPWARVCEYYLVIPIPAGSRSPWTAQDPGSWRGRAQAG